MFLFLAVFLKQLWSLGSRDKSRDDMFHLVSFSGCKFSLVFTVLFSHILRNFVLFL